MRRFALGLCATLLLTCCKRHEPAPALRASTAPSSRRAPAAPPGRDSRLLEAEALLKRWQDSQNQRDFAGYSALYGVAFRGTKRVDKKAFHFNRKGWLVDRQSMFVPGLSVGVLQLRVALAGSTVIATFRQEFATPAFRDVGPKLLALAPTPDGLRIVREELLSSQVEGGGGSVATLPGFFFARPDAVVLRSQIDERWLTAERRALDRKVKAWADNPDAEEPDETALAPDEVTLPPEVTAYVGKALYVSRAPLNGVQPPPCTAQVERISIVNTGTEVFEGTRIAARYGHLFDAVVLGRFRQPCPGALWASETPPGTQYLPEPASGALREAAQLAFTRSAGYPATQLTLVGDGSQQLLFASGYKDPPDGERLYKNLLFAVKGLRPPLTPLGPLDIDAVPQLALDADGDGRLEVLTHPGGDWGVVWLLQQNSATFKLTPVYQTPDFVCPG